MQLSAVLRGVRANVRWLQPGQLSLENRNILYFTVDTALQGVMTGGVFSFISVFLVRLGASELQVSLLTSLPPLSWRSPRFPAGQIVQRQRDLVKFTNIVRAFHRGHSRHGACCPVLAHDALRGLIIGLWTVKGIPTRCSSHPGWRSIAENHSTPIAAPPSTECAGP